MWKEIEPLIALRGTEREVVAEIVLLLSHIYKERLFADAGYPSLFVFCKECLGYSEGASYRRVEAAKAQLIDSSVCSRLKDGSLSLCSAAELAKVIKVDNAAQVLEKAAGKSKSEVKELIAELLPAKSLKKTAESVRVAKRLLPKAPLLQSKGAAPEEIKTYTVSLEFTEKEMLVIRKAQKALSTSKVKDTLLVAAKRLIQRKEKLESARERRAMAQIEAKASRTSPEKLRTNITQEEKRSRHIPVDVLHMVSKRDRNRCSYVSRDGVRCCETRNLELDHVRPFALGGSNEVENLRLLCKAHNRHAAEQVFSKSAIQSLIHFRQQ